MTSNNLKPQIQKLVDIGENALTIMHGELKNLMYDAEQEYLEAKRIEEEDNYSNAMDSMERKYWEGQLDALTHLYRLTYDLSFAIMDKERDK